MPEIIPDHVKQIVIPKQQAVFWMDAQGRWHNQHGPFQHKKIIDHFNASIGKDREGYFVGQYRDGLFEKVYFAYQETARFAVNLVGHDPVQMELNSGETVAVVPELLFIHGDQLFHRYGEEVIKFSEAVLMQISKHIESDDDGYLLRWMGASYRLKEQSIPDQTEK
jgi:hypothetical protein